MLCIQRVSGYKKPIGFCAGKDKIWPGCSCFAVGLAEGIEMENIEGILLSNKCLFMINGNYFK